MQNGGPSYTTRCIREKYNILGIKPLAWPPFSPDLYLIESVWDQIKTISEGHHPKKYAGGQRSPNRLREIVMWT